MSIADRTAPRPPPQLLPLVTADVALFSVADRQLQVLLVQRAQQPGQGLWALPGAVLNPDIDADLEATAARALREKLGVDAGHLEQVGVASGPARDPRGYSVALLFLALLPADRIQAVARSRVEAVQWCAVASPPATMAFDHAQLLARAASALRQRVARQALPLQLLPGKFTLTALQRSCEAVLGQDLDKGSFRRRLRSSVELEEVAGEYVGGVQRPAQLYRAAPGFRFQAPDAAGG